MSKKRNYTIDIFRAVAILSVLVYHLYVLAGYPYQGFRPLNRCFGIGGELGVTLFFIISGFGICSSLDRMTVQDEKIKVRTFLKKRFLRILPQYYACLAILLLITPNAQYMNRTGLFDIGTHLIFIHNWFPRTHGSINGVLWSMGTIFQFYFVAVFIYRALGKNKWLTCLGAIIVSVGAKIVIFHWILPGAETSLSEYFIYGRQIITALDNFVFGMVLCRILAESKEVKQKAVLCIGSIGILAVICWWIWQVETKSPYSDNLFGYLWHTVFALLLTVFMYLVCRMEWGFRGKISRIVLWISKYQYGIYIWHFVIASTLLSYSTAVQRILGHSFLAFAVCVSIICCMAGYASTLFFESVSYRKEWEKLKSEFMEKDE